jgi:catechol 2,3-dioxygenase-like lactoylglutathione lyase family enzyme
MLGSRPAVQYTRMISAIESITVGVRDLESACSLLRERMGYQVELDVRASVSLLSVWKLPVHEDVRLVTLSADGHPWGRVRLARFPDEGGAATRLDHGDGAVDRPTDVGPKALDIYTGPPIGEAVAALGAAGCPARGRPERFEIGSNDTEEVIVSGPDGVPLLLMVGHSHLPGSRRFAPAAGRFSEVATLSVVAADLDASRRFYEEGLGYVHEATDVELRVRDEDRWWQLWYSRQGSAVRSPSGNVDVDVEYLHVGGTAPVNDEGRVHSYVAGGIGATRFVPAGAGLDDAVEFSASLGIGLKMPLSDRVALRVEARGYLTVLDADTSIFCKVEYGEGGCAFVTTGSTLFQAELTAAIAFGF